MSPRKKSDNRSKLNQIIKDIKSIKIQGATNVARAALKAYTLVPSKSSKKKLIASRPTEPMMQKALELADGTNSKEILNHFDLSSDKIKENSLKIIKNGDRIFTHCHSTSVTKSLIYAKGNGKIFSVYNTETRPLYQGRKTARELGEAGIKVTFFVDSAAAIAIEKNNKNDKIYANKIFLGADALSKKGAINKVGSYLLAKLAHSNKIPVYIFADSWKFTRKKIPMEQRALNEVWNNAPKNVKVKNPAFEFIPKKYISGIVTEFGIMSYDQFLKKCN